MSAAKRIDRRSLAALPGVARLVELAAERPDLYLVGGAVRDLLRGQMAPRDLDLVVEGDPAPVLARLGGRSLAAARFGTGRAEIDGVAVDVARARSERYPHPGALPEVQPAAIEVDLRRRDFTINALAVALAGPRAGEVLAPPGALEDLERGRLRVLHDGSFRDDATRLLRLVRYGARLGFEIAEQTRALAEAAVREGLLWSVGGPRLGAELRLLADEPEAIRALALADELGVLAALAPLLRRPEPLVLEAARALLPREADPYVLLLGACCLGPLEHEVLELAQRLGLPAPAARRAARTAAVAGPLSETIRRGRIASLSELDRLLAAEPLEAVALAAARAAGGDLAPDAISPSVAAVAEWLARLRHARLQIDGFDLQAAGVSRGTALGRGLRAARAALLDGRAPGRREQLEVAVAEARRAPGEVERGDSLS